MSLVRREWRTQLRHSFSSRGPTVWGSSLVLLFAMSLGCSSLCLFRDFLTIMSPILLSEDSLFVSLLSVCSWRPSPKQPPASPNAIYFYLGAAVSFRMLLIGPLVTTGKVTPLSNSFWAALRNLYASSCINSNEEDSSKYVPMQDETQCSLQINQNLASKVL